MKTEELLSIVSQRIVSLDNPDNHSPFTGLYYALYSNMCDNTYYKEKSKEILSGFLSKKMPIWFDNGELGFYWTINYLGKIGLLDMTPYLKEKTMNLLNKYKETWGKIPWELHTEKEFYSEALFLPILWTSNEDSYEHFFIEEFIISSIDNMEEIVNNVFSKGQISLSKWLCVCYFIRFTSQNKIFSYKSNIILDHIISIIPMLPQDWILPTKLIFNDRFCTNNVSYKNDCPLGIFQSAILAIALNRHELFQCWNYKLTENPNLINLCSYKDIIGAGLGLITLSKQNGKKYF